MNADDQPGRAPEERRKRLFLDALARLVAKRVLERLNLKAIHHDEGPDAASPPSGHQGEEVDEEQQSRSNC